MTSSNEWAPGSPGSTTHGQHTAPDTLEGAAPEGTNSGEGANRAERVAGTAKEEGAHVAETAKTEVQQVAGEAKAKAADMLAEAKTQIDQQSRTQLQTLASKLEELSGEVDSMVEGSDVQGTMTDLARQLSEKTRALSTRLNDREPKDVLEDMRGFARQRPGTFLFGALAAGVIAGRLTRGVKKAHDSDISGPSDTSQSAGTAGTSPTSPATAGDLSYDSPVGGLGGDPLVPTGHNTGGRP